jgi:hypothetical protein
MLSKESAEAEEQSGKKSALDEVLKRAPFPPSQFIPKCLIHDAVLKGHIEWWGMGQFNGPFPTSSSGTPIPRRGCSRVHMVWTDSPA